MRKNTLVAGAVPNSENISKHKAIKLGFWWPPLILSLLVGAIAIFEAIHGFIFLFLLHKDGTANPITGTIVDYGNRPEFLILGIICVIAGLFLVYKSDGYWRRNIVGYRVAFWHNAQGQLRFGVFGWKVMLDEINIPEEAIVLIIPLGGWFLRQRNLEGGFWQKKNSRWLKNLSTPNWKIVVPNWVNEKPFVSKAKITDVDGNHIKMYIFEALEFFQKVGWSVMSELGMSWHGLYINTSRHLDGITAAAQEKLMLSQKLGLMERERDRAQKEIKEILIEAITRVQQLKLNVQSPTRNIIHLWLINQLLIYLSSEDPRRLEFERIKRALERS